MTLTLKLFGAPALCLNSDAVSLRRRKAMPLLAYLAEQALALSQGVGSRLQTARSLLELARARRLLDDRTSAKDLLKEAFALLSQRQWGNLQASCAMLLCDLAVEEQDVGVAERWFREASMLEPGSASLPGLAVKLDELRGGREEWCQRNECKRAPKS